MGRGSSKAGGANSGEKSTIPKSVLDKLPNSGAKLHSAYIEFVKTQLNINLTSARDSQFDTKRFFNVDVRDLGGGNVQKGQNALGQIKSLNAKSYNPFDVAIESNGANRVAITVKKKKKL